MARGFTIQSISLRNFRNHSSYVRKFEPGQNQIIGANATGKTNVIEAIALMTQISSFRSSQIVDLINKDSNDDFASVEIEILDNDTDTKNIFTLTICDNKKTYKLNGKKKKISELKGRFPSVVFTPDDLELVKGSNTIRRQEIDNLGDQISKEYYRVAHDYTKALKQKNSLLKDNSPVDLLKSINDVLILTGAQLVYFRHALVNKIKPIIEDYYKKIAGDNELLGIQYFPSWAMDDELVDITRDKAREFLKQAFDEKINEEQARCRALIGPHRDRIVFTLNGSDAQSFASQGQQRSIVLAFKLTEVKLIEDLLDKKPILLLDDVMSELDESRRSKLSSFVDKQTQSFITSAV